MRKAVILLILAGVFFCILSTLGPLKLKEALGAHLGKAALITFGFLGGFVVLAALACSGLDAAEMPARQQYEATAEEERIRAIEKENAALRQWAKSGKMPVKLSPKGDSER